MHKSMFAARFKATAALLLTLLVGAAGAQQTSGVQSYDVELVIFRTVASSATAEEWALESGLPPPQQPISPDDESSSAIAAAPPATATETFPTLPSGKFKLTAVEDTLKRGRNYQVLGHFGWTQPGFPRSEAHYMSIDAQVAPGLTGRVALARGRYLHLTVDMVLQDSAGERFVLQHTRRMRSNERHFIDHPKFGVIALITPTQG